MDEEISRKLAELWDALDELENKILRAQAQAIEAERVCRRLDDRLGGELYDVRREVERLTRHK